MCNRNVRLTELARVTCFLVSLGSLVAAAESDVVTKLSWPVQDVAVANSGQTLVLKLHGQKGLTIYDAKTQKLEMLELPTSDFVFGAGGGTAVVFFKENNELRSYSLKNLALVKAKDFIEPVAVKRIVMGHSRGDVALIRFGRETEGLRATNQILDVATLSIPRAPGPHFLNTNNSTYEKYVHFRADGEFERITDWSTSNTPTGIGMLIRTKDGYQHFYNHRSAGYLVPGDDGLIYSGYGIIFSLPPEPHQNFVQAGNIEGMSLLPGLGGLFFMGIDRDGGLTVYEAGQTSPLCPIPSFPNWLFPKRFANGLEIPTGPLSPVRVEEFIQNPLTLDKRITFVPAAGYILFLPFSNDKVIRRDFNLQESLDRTGKDYLLVLSKPPLRSKAGDQWEYKIAALAKHGPVTFMLEKSPGGMSMSHEGDLSWKVPKGIQGEAKVVVAVTDGSSKLRHSFTVEIE